MAGRVEPAFPADLTYAEPATPASKWDFRFTPYGWMINIINGDITARGHTADINQNFFQIVDKSDSLLAWMSYFEARRGKLGLFTDVVWMDLGYPGKFQAQRSPLARFPQVVVSVRGKAQLDYQQTIVQSASPMRSRAGKTRRAASPPSMCWAARAIGTRMPTSRCA